MANIKLDTKAQERVLTEMEMLREVGERASRLPRVNIKDIATYYGVSRQTLYALWKKRYGKAYTADQPVRLQILDRSKDI